MKHLTFACGHGGWPGDLSDILMGHSTWDTYSSMVRIYKHYDFGVRNPDHVMRRLSFSSYPGELFSDDDL
jgi:Phospholipase B